MTSDAFIPLDLFGTGPQDPRPAKDYQLFSRRLRFALAMRGGVSLAVWIGGAVSELDILRRIRLRGDRDGTNPRAYLVALGEAPDDEVVARATVYARLLYRSGYDRAEFDVLSGASAGGLNAVMYAAAQRAGASVEGLRSTWEDVGGFGDLLQGEGFGRVNAPLRGDAYFFPGVLDALTDFYTGEGVQRSDENRARRIVVDLSATVIDTEDSADPQIASGRGHFHFVGGDVDIPRNGSAPTSSTGRTGLLDEGSAERGRRIPFRGQDAATDAHDLARMAYAARTTSSVPAGFEPAVIHSGERDEPESGAEGVDFSYAFHAHRRRINDTETPYRVVDGGVTDNIPIERALRAIRSYSADHAADRVLLYLDPKPPRSLRPNAPEAFEGLRPQVRPDRRAPTRPDPLSRILRAGPRAFKHFLWVESGSAEADQVEAFDRELALARGRDAGLWAISANATFDPPTMALAYARYRQNADAALLTRVLSDPSMWQLGSNLERRAVLGAWNPADLRALISDLSKTRHDDVVDAVTVLDTCLALLSWTDALEQAAFAADRQMWRAAPTGVRTGMTSLDEVRSHLFEVQQYARRQRDAQLNGVIVGARGDALVNWQTSPTLDPQARAWLAKAAKTLAAIGATMPEWTTTPSPWRHFVPDAEAPYRAAHFMVARGIPDGFSDIRYWEITANRAPEGNGLYRGLVAFQQRFALQRAVSSREGALRDARDEIAEANQLDAVGKLTGATLGGFAGFLSKQWRTNDWFWGRMDASGGVTELLLSMPDVVADAGPRLDPVTVTDSAATLEDSIIAEITAGAPELIPRRPRERLREMVPGSLRPQPKAEGREAWVTGADTLRNLDPSYRTSLATRAVHALVRSLTQTNAGLTVVLALLRPALGGLATLIDPPRFAAIASVILGGVVLVGEAGARFDTATLPWLPGVWKDLTEGRITTATAWFVVFCVALGTAVILTVISAVRGGLSWGRVARSSGGVPRWMATERRWSTAISTAWILLGTVTVAAALVASALWNLSALGAVVVSLAGLVFLIIGARRRRTVRQPNGYLLRDNLVGLLAAAILAVATVFAAAVITALTQLHVSPVPAITAAVALLVWKIMAVGTFTGFHRVPTGRGAGPEGLAVLGVLGTGVVSAAVGYGIALLIGGALVPSTPSALAAAAGGAFAASYVHWIGAGVLPALHRPADRSRRIRPRLGRDVAVN